MRFLHLTLTGFAFAIVFAKPVDVAIKDKGLIRVYYSFILYMLSEC